MTPSLPVHASAKPFAFLMLPGIWSVIPNFLRIHFVSADGRSNKKRLQAMRQSITD